MSSDHRVCIVTGQYPPQIGGVGHSAHRIANFLASHGLDIHVVAFQKHDRPLPIDEAVETTQEGRVQVHRARVFYEQSSPENPVSESTVLTRYNREMYEVLQRMHDLHGFTIMHGFFLYPASFISGMVGRMNGIRTIASIRGNDIGKYAFDPIRMPFIRQALENADRITSVATSLIELADRAITPISDRAQTILNSIDLAKMAPAGKAPVETNGLAIGSIGLFRYKKGIGYLSKALGQLRDKVDFTFILVGDYFKEEDRAPHLEMFADDGVADRTTVTGRVAHNEVANWLQALDIVVFPSLFSEGCPLSMLEAMAMGKVIVGTNAGAIPEIIRHRENGLLVPRGSSEALAAALGELAADAALRKKLGAAAMDTARQMRPEIELNAWLDLYRELQTAPGDATSSLK